MADNNMFGNFDPATYHFSDHDLQQIITKTDNAVQEMNNLGKTVGLHTESLGAANRSDSGQILSGHLGTWQQNFYACVNNLADLNHKATALLQVNRGVNTSSASQAR